MNANLVEVKNLGKIFRTGGFFPGRRKLLRAVNGVTFSIEKGETLGLVGESGCGKSTTGRLILRLIEATAGQVFFEGQSLFNLNKKDMQKQRRKMQMIFQDPFSSLNPRMAVADIIAEPLLIHGLGGAAERSKRVSSLMDMVGLTQKHAGRFPHEFSGGQRQRIGIARALALNPMFVVADEPVSSLDVSMRAQVLNLMQDLQEALGLTYLFIAHDLSIVRHLSDRVAVMYLGKIVEIGPTARVFNEPGHPYTRNLLAAVRIPDPEISRERVIIRGEIPSPFHLPRGCRFHTRCPVAMEICRNTEPEPEEISGGHAVSCHIKMHEAENRKQQVNMKGEG